MVVNELRGPSSNFVGNRDMATPDHSLSTLSRHEVAGRQAPLLLASATGDVRLYYQLCAICALLMSVIMCGMNGLHMQDRGVT